MADSKPLCILDLTKFILSFFIAAIHTGFLGDTLYPWLRTAVPIFFIISSYLFFRKQKTESDPARKKEYLDRFVLRNFKLYIFWFIVLFPFIVNDRSGWFRHGFFASIALYVRDFFLKETFAASWFIMALIISVSLIFYLNKKLSNRTMFVLALLVYLFITVTDTYNQLLAPFSSVAKAVDIYQKVFTSGANSFPAAIIWCVIGKMFAESERKPLNVWTASGLTLISAAACYAEWRFVCAYTDLRHPNCMITLVALCPLMFSLIKRININLKHSKQLRNTSTIIYTTHCAFKTIFTLLFKQYGIENRNLVFPAVIVCSLITAFVILKLEKKKPFEFLKYSH